VKLPGCTVIIIRLLHYL